jgi:alpha-glucosidase
MADISRPRRRGDSGLVRHVRRARARDRDAPPPGQPWHPLHDMAESLNVSAEGADKDSMLALYRRLIELRCENDALQAGEFTGLPAPEGTVCFARQSPRSRVVVLLNFTGNRAVVPLRLPGAAMKACLMVSTDSARLPGFLDLSSVELGPHEGLVLDVPAAADVSSPVL